MEILQQDILYALRLIRKSPSFAIIVVLTLALGIGANTAIFSLLNAVLLSKLPVKDAEHLVIVGDPLLAHLRANAYPPRVDLWSYQLFCDLRDNNSVLSEMLLTGEVPRMRVTRTSEGRDGLITESAMGVLVSGNYFSMLGVNALKGRTLMPADDDVIGAHPVAVVSYGFWQENLGGDPGIVGQTIRFRDYPFTIVGVAPPTFLGDITGDHQDIWFPVTMANQVVRNKDFLTGYGNSWFHIMARLKTGITAAQARESLNILFQQFVNGPMGTVSKYSDRESLRKLRVEVVDGSRGFSALRGTYQGPLWLLMGIVGLVLLIACVNVANLMLARAIGRRREVALRLALGAGSWRIMRQLLTESILLSFTGGALGLLVARWGVQILLRVNVGTTTDVHLDLRVLAFTAATCVVSGILSGLVPALRAMDVSLITVLKSRSGVEAGGNSHTGWNWGGILIVGQVALSVWVLFAAGLLVRSLKNLRNIDVGMNRENLLFVRLDQNMAGYTTPEQRSHLADQIAGKLQALPGVRGVTFSQNGLYYSTESADTIRVDGFIPRTSKDLLSVTDRVGPNYFSVLGIRLERGREITADDMQAMPKVAVINESFAKFYFDGVDPVGRTLWVTDEDPPIPMRIVGVVANAHDQALRGAIAPRFYAPIAQATDAIGVLNFMVRTTGNPNAIVESARGAVRDYNSKIPILGIRSMTDRIDESIRGEITIADLSGFFGVLGLALACMGMYGLMTYSVASKRKSIGVRRALGAHPVDILRIVLGEALKLVGAGILIGVPVALLCGRFIASMLYGLNASDPISLILVIAALGFVATIASFLPAWRATRVDPLIALREE
jgi:predicted permease